MSAFSLKLGHQRVGQAVRADWVSRPNPQPLVNAREVKQVIANSPPHQLVFFEPTSDLLAQTNSAQVALKLRHRRVENPGRHRRLNVRNGHILRRLVLVLGVPLGVCVHSSTAPAVLKTA